MEGAMFNRMVRTIALVLLVVLPFTGVAPASAAAIPSQPMPLNVASAEERMVGFLVSQYDSAVGLLEESPVIGAGKYYLNNCNYLSPMVLAAHGEKQMADEIGAVKRKYGFTGNGFIEVVSGTIVTWPPNHHCDIEVDQVEGNVVLQEYHDRQLCQAHGFYGGYFADWEQYANLTFMGVVNLANQGNKKAARDLFNRHIAGFNGLGFKDLAYYNRAVPEYEVEGVYETLGVAWALYAGSLIDAFSSKSMRATGDQLVKVLLGNQGSSGGVHTHYVQRNDPRADPNVETTSMTILALDAYYGR